MRLVATLLTCGAAIAVYSEEKVEPGDLIANHATDADGVLVFDAGVRLVPIYDAAPPLVLEPDLSESLHDKG